MKFMQYGPMLAAWLGFSTSRLIAAPETVFQAQCIEPDGNTGTSKAVIIGDVPLVHTTQIFQPTPVGNSDVSKQTERTLAKLGEVLGAAESDLESVVKLSVYLAKAELMPQVQ